MTEMDAPCFLDAGEAALVVEFGRIADARLNDRVLALDAALAGSALPGIVELVPTFRSLMIHYDPLHLSRAALVAAVQALLPTLGSGVTAPVHWEVPCCYDPEFGEDIGNVSDMLGLTPDRVVALHSAMDYRIYMYGFVPGGCYLGPAPPELAISRRFEPRPPAPENIVILGGGMTATISFPMPTGWWLIGRTPETMFSRARPEPFFARVGDTIRFVPVDAGTFRALEARVKQGELVARRRAS